MLTTCASEWYAAVQELLDTNVQQDNFGPGGRLGQAEGREVAMAVWVSSDWHCEPGKLKDNVVNWVCTGKKANHRLIGNGDLFDILPYGRKEWEPPTQPVALQEFLELLGGYDFDYVTGNHDPYSVMRKLLAGYPNIKVHRKSLAVAGEEGRQYFLTHGHRWAIDWGFFRLRQIAPPLVEFMVEYFPNQWYGICRHMGWLASQPSPWRWKGKETERITNLTRVIWGGATQHALKETCCVVLGHTHTVGRQETTPVGQRVCCAYVVDGGDLGRDGSYVEIAKDAEVKFL